MGRLPSRRPLQNAKSDAFSRRKPAGRSLRAPGCDASPSASRRVQPNCAPMDPKLLRDCVHCGFCLPSCPSYVVFNEEMDSPRGRIWLMQAITRRHGRAEPHRRRALRPLPRLHGLPHLVPVRGEVRQADRARARANRGAGAAAVARAAAAAGGVRSVPASAAAAARAARSRACRRRVRSSRCARSRRRGASRSRRRSRRRRSGSASRASAC